MPETCTHAFVPLHGYKVQWLGHRIMNLRVKSWSPIGMTDARQSAKSCKDAVSWLQTSYAWTGEPWNWHFIINRTLETTSLLTLKKGRNLRKVITQNVIWTNQKIESFVYCWLRAHVMFDVTYFPAFVGAWVVMSSVLSIRISWIDHCGWHDQCSKQCKLKQIRNTNKRGLFHVKTNPASYDSYKYLILIDKISEENIYESCISFLAKRPHQTGNITKESHQ